ncbi:trypco2 family protein [Streptomyces sp. NPDC058251]|uniref:trypco2 family protein n=1 Tax=unclassified Streptomyces TaxID=2593676 RepID=UPI0036EBDDCE
MSEFGEIELSVAIRAIRDQLLQAAAEGAHEDLKFEVGPIQMDFSVEVRRDINARGGVKAWLTSAEVTANKSTGQTHRVSFTLTPKDSKTGGSVEVGNLSPGGLGNFAVEN